jgi:hypothetical protein
MGATMSAYTFASWASGELVGPFGSGVSTLAEQAAAIAEQEGHGAGVELAPAGPPQATFLGDFTVDGDVDAGALVFDPQIVTATTPARLPLWLALVLGGAAVAGLYWLGKG